MTGCERWTHRLAVGLVVLTLGLPVLMGSLTTTLGAGMAFLDWPTSDGQNMLFYNIFRDIREGNVNKVAEHGHRLAGMVVGLLSIPLAITGWFDRRRGVRTLTLAILLGVVAQGILGGFRVLLSEQVLAMIHSICAAVLVAVMGLTAMVTTRQWSAWRVPNRRPSAGLVILSGLLPCLIILQYVAGGLIRHFGTAIAEHLAGAAVVGIAAAACAMWSAQSRITELLPWAWSLLAAVALQLLLGVGAWAGKFGLAAFGIVAIERGVLQVTLRTIHTAGGMLLLMASAMLALAVIRARFSGRRHSEPTAYPECVARPEAAGQLEFVSKPSGGWALKRDSEGLSAANRLLKWLLVGGLR